MVPPPDPESQVRKLDSAPAVDVSGESSSTLGEHEPGEHGPGEQGHSRCNKTEARASSETERACSRPVQVAKEVMSRSAQDRVTTSAASLAFHWFLAIFPTAIALVSLLKLIGLSNSQLHALTTGVNTILPTQAASVVDQSLRSPISTSAGVAGIVLGGLTALWSVIEAMAALQVALDVAFGVPRDRKLIARRVASLPLLGLTIMLGGAAFALIVLGQPIGTLLRGDIPVAGPEFEVVWAIVRWLGAVALVGLLVSAFLTFGPAVKPEPRSWFWLSPGSLLGTGGWIATSAGFSYYLDHLGHEARTYGAIAGVAVLLLWLFVTGTILLLGAELDAVLILHRDGYTS